MESQKHGCVIRAGEQKDIWLLADHLKPMLGPDHTDGKLAIAVSRCHPGDGPPPHIHRREDEAFYILDGEMTFLCGDALVTALPGTFVWGPRDAIHCFQCTSETPAKMLLMVTPTQFLNFAMTLAQPAPDFNLRPALTPERVGRLMEVAPQYGIEMKPDHPLPTASTLAQGASKRLWVMGEHVSYLATSDQTGGQFTVVEIRTAPQGGPPPHVHTREDEIFYVIEQDHEVLLGDITQIAHPGDMVFIPKGVRHRYSNIGGAVGKILSIHTPGGFESFFDECGVDADMHATAPPMDPPPREALEALLARHGMTA